MSNKYWISIVHFQWDGIIIQQVNIKLYLAWVCQLWSNFMVDTFKGLLPLCFVFFIHSNLHLIRFKGYYCLSCFHLDLCFKTSIPIQYADTLDLTSLKVLHFEYVNFSSKPHLGSLSLSLSFFSFCIPSTYHSKVSPHTHRERDRHAHEHTSSWTDDTFFFLISELDWHFVKIKIGKCKENNSYGRDLKVEEQIAEATDGRNSEITSDIFVTVLNDCTEMTCVWLVFAFIVTQFEIYTHFFLCDWSHWNDGVGSFPWRYHFKAPWKKWVGDEQNWWLKVIKNFHVFHGINESIRISSSSTSEMGIYASFLLVLEHTQISATSR